MNCNPAAYYPFNVNTVGEVALLHGSTPSPGWNDPQTVTRHINVALLRLIAVQNGYIEQPL
jgi:hypothetical protein